jgi:hypothetical protein
MVSNTIIQNILNIIENATPDKCKITTNPFIYKSTNNCLTIHNYREDYITINICENKEEKYYIAIRSSTGIHFHGEIEQLEYLNIQTAILNCCNTFNKTINEFCETFY